MSINDILDGLIASATADKNTLDALIAQLQHTTITSSDDEVYTAPTFNETTGIWTLKQEVANIGGLFVGCYKLPVTGIESYISSINIVSYVAPTSPSAPATVTPAVGSPVDLANIADLEGQSFNSFCIRSISAFEIQIQFDQTWCHLIDFTVNDGGFTPVINPGIPGAIYGFYSAAGWTSNYNIVNSGNTEVRITKTLSAPAHFTHIKMTYVGTTVPTDVYSLNFATPNLAGAASATVESDIDVTTDNLRTDIYVHNGSQSYTIQSIEFRGTGIIPSEFGTDNCV